MDNAVSLSPFFLALLAQSLGRGLGSRVSKQREGSTLTRELVKTAFLEEDPPLG